ncbi:YihY/virulence factor BrkB family protein [Arenicella xantha]|uniref:Membrane protein n=1 Tax=Arenicella xantha TaxID=644221 RepID=A0A395JQQ0_9GAMM|nr:YihY/virulence factor BrkB family protein [Arenicella xantha]RBP52776.1 membrane protein [Arenicella xantha]
MLDILTKAAKNWNNDDPFRHAAIIAYYAIFSMPGLLIIVIWFAGAVFGQDAVQGQLSEQLTRYLGDSGSTSIEKIIANARLDRDNPWMKILGIGTLVFGATTLFLQLQKSLNEIWGVKSAARNGLLKLLADRATSLGVIIAIGFLLLISLIMSTTISIIASWIETSLGPSWLFIIRAINITLSIGLTSLLFALMFKVLPDVDIRWRSVWTGAITAGLMFTIGKTLLGIYFGYSQPGNTFGAAGSIILVMLWINYTCLILFFGANVAQAYAVQRGHPITPSAHAEWLAASRSRVNT